MRDIIRYMKVWMRPSFERATYAIALAIAFAIVVLSIVILLQQIKTK